MAMRQMQFAMPFSISTKHSINQRESVGARHHQNIALWCVENCGGSSKMATSDSLADCYYFCHLKIQIS